MDVNEAATKAKVCAEILISCIEESGLRISSSKTEACVFYKGETPAALPYISIGGEYVRVGLKIKYLGLLLYSRLTFAEHFERITERAERVVLSLSRIMPNLRGAGELRRRLYASVVQSIMYYGAPIWADRVVETRI